ncbi:Putative gamma-glutamylcyclotransferase At3g02910 [Linum perenne]
MWSLQGSLPPQPPRVSGQLYAVSAHGLARLDQLEGTVTGHYERLPIKVEPPADGGVKAETIDSGGRVEVYFAGRSYAAEMWERCGKIGYSVYGEEATVWDFRGMSFSMHIM